MENGYTWYTSVFFSKGDNYYDCLLSEKVPALKENKKFLKEAKHFKSCLLYMCIHSPSEPFAV